MGRPTLARFDEHPGTPAGSRGDVEYFVRSHDRRSDVLCSEAGGPKKSEAQFFGDGHRRKALRWVESEINFHGTLE